MNAVLASPAARVIYLGSQHACRSPISTSLFRINGHMLLSQSDLCCSSIQGLEGRLLVCTFWQQAP